MLLKSGLGESFGVTGLDFRNHGFRSAAAQDHALQGLSGNLIESRLDDGVGDHTSALLHELLPAFLIGGLGRGEVGVIVDACPGDDFAAARGDYLRSRAGHVFDELPSGVLARRIRIDAELETIDGVLVGRLHRRRRRPC